ncbi:MAG: glycosyltransferase family 4 protein [Synechococcales cyanobacterium RM1_1_8]|nr:glycosyltransferase family 4 protein [Synechococcales cyanobacterium RM1_1_8]
MKVALVHDFLTQPGGAERVFELLCKRYPDADIYTSIYNPRTSVDFGDRPVHTTWLQRLPGSSRYFRFLAPFYFSAFRSLDLREYDLIISHTTSFAKAVRKRPDAKHVCFCHNVTRFLWDTKTYLREFGPFRQLTPLLDRAFEPMRKVDLAYAQEPDVYIANSRNVAERIKRIYQKPAFVINCPVDGDKFRYCDRKGEFYLASARLISYKRMDVIVEAFNWLGWPLIITGDGPERERLEKRAMGNISFLGHVSDSERKRLMSTANAVIIAALEDYGLVPIEANASGTPVIAYGAGGVLETQQQGRTGLFFNRQSPESLVSALMASKGMDWNYEAIRSHALEHFSKAAFFTNIDQVMERCLAA